MNIRLNICIESTVANFCMFKAPAESSAHLYESDFKRLTDPPDSNPQIRYF